MIEKVPFGFCGYDNEIVTELDIVKNRFSLDNPWQVMEIYKCGSSYYYHVGRGTKDVWFCNNDVEYVCRWFEHEPLLAN